VPLRAELLAALAVVPGASLRAEEPVARHGALRIGGDVEAFVTVHDEAGLLGVAEALRAARQVLRPCWPLADAFCRDAGLAGALLRLGPAFGEVQAGPDGIEAGAAAPLACVGAVAARLGHAGWSPLSTWPGTVGAWCADLEGPALAGLFRRVRVLTGRGIRDHEGAAVAGVPRSALLLRAWLPPAPTAGLPPRPPWPGEAFAEGGAAGEDVRAALLSSRLAGLRLRGIRLASEQVGLVVNLGAGTARDLDLLLRVVVDRLGRDHGLNVQPRLQPSGRPPSAGPLPTEDQA